MALWVHNYSVYGRRKLWKAAQRAGIDAGRDQVARLMRANGLRGASRAKKRFTTKADPEHTRAPDLVKRNFTATRPDELWVADFTYCSTWSGVVYVAFIIDVYSRRLVGWKAARSMTDTLVIDALNMAAWTRRHTGLDGLVCHTDAGSQYTSIAYTERLYDVGAAPSIGTVGDSYDNAMAESVMGLFKTELHRNAAALETNGGPWTESVKRFETHPLHEFRAASSLAGGLIHATSGIAGAKGERCRKRMGLAAKAADRVAWR